MNKTKTGGASVNAYDYGAVRETYDYDYVPGQKETRIKSVRATFKKREDANRYGWAVYHADRLRSEGDIPVKNIDIGLCLDLDYSAEVYFEVEATDHNRRFEETANKTLWEDFVDLMDELHYLYNDDEPCRAAANKLLNALEDKYKLNGKDDPKRQYPNSFYPINPME